jgi:RND superfamily putative drug exporter
MSGRAGAAVAFARLCVRLRWSIVVMWIGGAAAATMLLPTIRQAQVGSLGDLVPRKSDAVEAEVRSKRLFGFPLVSRTLVVQRDGAGLSVPDQARVLRRAVALNRHELPAFRGIAGALPITNALGRPPFSKERSTTAITYLFFGPDIGQTGRNGLANLLVEAEIRPANGHFAGVTGTIPARAAQAGIVEERLPLVELATVVLVAVAVGIHFRALGAPLLNLVAVALAYLISIRVIATVGKAAGVSVPSEVQPVIVVLLFGVLTDYSIFFLSRFRRLLDEGVERREASVRTTAELLPIIVTAGLTVAAATAVLVVAELGFFEAFGPGMAMGVLIALLVAITFVPAALALLGGALFWPLGPDATAGKAGTSRSAEARGRPRRWRAVGLAAAHPVLTAMVCLGVLLAASSGLLGLRLGNPLIRGLPDGTHAKTAYAEASQGFAAGILSPTVVVVEDRGIVGRRAELQDVQSALARQPGVAAVVGPAQYPLGRPFGAVLSRTGNAARYFVVLDSDPLGSTAIRDMRRIRAQLPGLLDASGLRDARVSIAGDTALSAETVDKTVADLGRIAPASLLVVLIILSIFLRALVAPLYLVASSVLALAAGLGLTAYLFQHVVGHDGLSYYVPFAGAVLLVSLGSDYNVFLTGRIWEEARRRPLREAVVVAGARAATPITTAGLVLALSFALLALVPVRSFRELAVAMAAGLVIDAFVVRTFLVPALITLVGARSGWPGKRLRAVAAGVSPRRAARRRG